MKNKEPFNKYHAIVDLSKRIGTKSEQGIPDNLIATNQKVKMYLMNVSEADFNSKNPDNKTLLNRVKLKKSYDELTKQLDNLMKKA